MERVPTFDPNCFFTPMARGATLTPLTQSAPIANDSLNARPAWMVGYPEQTIWMMTADERVVKIYNRLSGT